MKAFWIVNENEKSIRRAFLFIGFILLFAIHGNSQNIFEYLNLDYPGLEKVREYYRNGNVSVAEKELLEFYRNRHDRVFNKEMKSFPCDVKEADDNIRNRFEFKNSWVDFGNEIDWRRKHGDNQWQFSLNRMKWFDNYIGAYQKTGDEKYVRAWMRQIDSWIRLNDPGFPRTIDTGQRLAKWVISHWMFVHVLKSPAVTADFNAGMLLSMERQAEFLYQPSHWRRYSNWGTFENNGFALFALLYPEFRANSEWLKEIFFRMRFQMEHSYYDDGMHIEVSPGYHGHELEVWLKFYRLAEANAIEDPLHSQMPLTPIKSLFINPVRALAYLYKPTGVVPQVGDTDERDERDFLLEAGEYLNLPDVIYAATGGKEETPPSQTSAAFPEGGYFIMRSGWGDKDLPFEKELYLLFDCGSNRPWHAHYDMLNVVITAFGYDLLKDAGRYTYNRGEERDYFKSTKAHNTVVIDDLDQQRYYTPEAAEWYSFQGFDYVVGSHVGYNEIRHNRSVFFANREYWIIIDRFIGKGIHRFDQYWHLSEKSKGKIKVQDGGRMIIAPHMLLFSPGHGSDLSVEKGYLSYSYRRKVEAPVICFSKEKPCPVSWTTVIYPYQKKIPDVKVINLIESYEILARSESEPIAIKITREGEMDYFIEQETSGKIIEVLPFITDAKAVHVSIGRNGMIKSISMVRGTYLKYGKDLLIRIFGEKADVSITGKTTEIRGDFISGFRIYNAGQSDVVVNGKVLKTKVISEKLIGIKNIIESY